MKSVHGADTRRQKLRISCAWKSASDRLARSGHHFFWQQQSSSGMEGVFLPVLVALCFGKSPTEGSAEITFAAAFFVVAVYSSSSLLPHFLHWLSVFPNGAVKTKCSPVTEGGGTLDVRLCFFLCADKQKQTKKKWIFVNFLGQFPHCLKSSSLPLTLQHLVSVFMWFFLPLSVFTSPIQHSSFWSVTAVKAFRWQTDSYHYTHYLRSSLAFFVVVVVYPQAFCERVINSFLERDPKLNKKIRAEAQETDNGLTLSFFRTTSASRGALWVSFLCKPKPGFLCKPKFA